MESPFHVFSVEGEDYVVNPSTMRFAKVGARTAEALRRGSVDVDEIESKIGSPRWPSERKEPEWKFAPPDKIVLMLTYACNMACRYCCQGEIPDVRETEMPEAVARRAVDWVIEQSGSAPTIGIGWFGGEPLMKFGIIRARPEHKIGSIYEPTLHNEIHKKSLLFNADECPRCWARFYCGGGCIVEHMGATGSIFKANPETCRWRKGKFEQAIRVVASLEEDGLRFLGEQGLIRYC